MHLRFEGFTTGQELTIRADYNRMLDFAPAMLSDGVHFDRWFGAADRNVVLGNYRRMASVLVESHRSIMFVNRADRPGHPAVLRVSYQDVYTPVLHAPNQAPTRLNPMAGAYVFPTDRRNETLDSSAPMTHVGSGMRIYLCASYFTSGDDERASTIFHEITHKVLATEDFAYGERSCLRLRDDQKIRNADNYALCLID